MQGRAESSSGAGAGGRGQGAGGRGSNVKQGNMRKFNIYRCHSLSSSAFVSSPLYGPSCFPVIISSVSVSLVLIMSQVSPVMSPYISLFYPMLPVDYC